MIGSTFDLVLLAVLWGFCSLLAIVFVAVWVAAWLHWIFDGEIRHFLFARIFPLAWRAGRESDEILLMSPEEFEVFLSGESQAPGFVRGVLGCPGCLSTYLSAFGTLLAAASILPWLLAAKAFPSLWWLILSVCVLPLIWAGGAWIGHRAHNYC